MHLACDSGGFGITRACHVWRGGPRARRAASIGLVALYLALLPANVNKAVNDGALDGKHLPPVALWLRLPFQLVFIGWAIWVGGGRARHR